MMEILCQLYLVRHQFLDPREQLVQLAGLEQQGQLDSQAEMDLME
jgi:hypothetical protein